MRDLDDVGEVIFALGVLVADGVEQGERMAAGNRHQPAIAEADLLLGLGGVLFLADGHELAARLDEPAVAGWIVRTEADNHDRSTLGKLPAGREQRLGLDQRRIAEHDEDVVIAARDRRAGREHGMAGAEALFLDEDFRCGVEARGRLADLVGAVADDQRDIRAAGRLRRRRDMRDHRQTGDLVQHLGLGALHARALAGGKDDRQAASLGHGCNRWLGIEVGKDIPALCCANAVKFRCR